MKFLDLFAGIGGFRLGLESNGHECVGFCEIDKYARQSYKAIHNTENEVEFHDITTITNEQLDELPGVDIICGGFPCQSFSIAGKRKGFDETRGTLFFEIARLAKYLKPKYLFLENVKGLLNHDKGRTFETIIRTLDELGYDAEWCVCNSKDYVPQNRERIFIIGHLRGERTGKVFPIVGESGTVESHNEIKQLNDAKRIQGFKENKYVYDVKGISSTLCARDYEDPKKIAIPIKEATKRGYTLAEPGDSVNLEQPKSKTRRGRVGKQVANTLLTNGQMGVVVPVLTPDRVKKRQNGRRFKENGEPMFTITARDRHGIMLDDFTIRKLTPRECWRLQGFPDWAFDRAEKVVSNSQLYKQAGNSVTVPLIAAIASRF